MGDFNKPDVLNDVEEDLTTIKDNIQSSITWLESIVGLINIPQNTKRFNVANKRFEKYVGSSWVELLAMATASLAYQIRVQIANVADLATLATTAQACSGNSLTATTANNSNNLGGSPAANYVLKVDVIDVQHGGTNATNQANAQTNLDVYGKGISDTRFAKNSDNLNLLTSVSTARNKLSVHSKAYIDASTYVTTAPSLAMGSTVLNAPSGYKYVSMNTTISFTAGSIVVTAVNSAGTSVTVNNSFSAGFTQLVVWSKIG